MRQGRSQILGDTLKGSQFKAALKLPSVEDLHPRPLHYLVRARYVCCSATPTFL